MKQTRPGSPASAMTAPSSRATACTRWRASTTPPRRTTTLSGSMFKSVKPFWPESGLWRHRDFLKLWAGQTISEFGTQFSLIALPLTAIYVLHARAFAVASLTIFEQLPFLLFALPAGVWVDRLARRPILIIGDAGRAVALASIPIAYAAGVLHIWQLFTVAFVVGVLTVFFDVAYQSYLPSLVARDQLVEGNSKLQASASVAQLAGPGVAGPLIKLVTAPYAILVDVASFIASSAFVLSIRRPDLAPSEPAERPGMKRELMVGLRYVLSIRTCARSRRAPRT